MAATGKRYKAEQTYYRWRKIYGGLKVDQAKKIKEIEAEEVGCRNILV